MKRSAPKIINIAIVAFCVIMLAVGVLVANRSRAKQTNPNYVIEYELVRVEKVVNNSYSVDPEAQDALRGSQTLKVRILTGRYKGDTMLVGNYLGPMHEKLAKQGTVLTAVITTDRNAPGYQMSIVNYDFTWLIAGMLLVFIAAVVIVGRKKGVMSLFGLLYSLIAIVFFLIPMWLKGYSAIILTMVCSLFITVFSFTLLGGVTRKTVSAMLGTVLCVIVSGAFALLCGKIARVSGMTMDEAEWFLDESRTLEGVTLKVRGLLVSGIIISALGAVMDVAMSIASSVNELREVNPHMSSGELFRSGMNIGRDLIGTMTNTLILAFVGTTLNVMIVMFSAGMQFYQLINNDALMMELIRATAGSIGLILAVPLTAFISSRAAK